MLDPDFLTATPPSVTLTGLDALASEPARSMNRTVVTETPGPVDPEDGHHALNSGAKCSWLDSRTHRAKVGELLDGHVNLRETIPPLHHVSSPEGKKYPYQTDGHVARPGARMAPAEKACVARRQNHHRVAASSSRHLLLQKNARKDLARGSGPIFTCEDGKPPARRAFCETRSSSTPVHARQPGRAACAPP